MKDAARREGRSIKLCFLVAIEQLKLKKNSDPCLPLTLTDLTGTVEVKL